MTALFAWLAPMLLSVLVWHLLRFLYNFLGFIVIELFWGKAIELIAFFAGMAFIRYILSATMSLLGIGVIYYFAFDRFVSAVYSLIVDRLLGLPPEFTQWLVYFGVIDGLRLLEATFIWIVGIKAVMWALKPPSSPL